MSTKPITALIADRPMEGSIPEQKRESAEQGRAKDEINISGIRVLLVLAISVLLTNGLVWALVRHWLFAP